MASAADYRLLGLSGPVTRAEARRAFLALVKRCHPDALPAAATPAEQSRRAEAFRRLRAAYDAVAAELAARELRASAAAGVRPEPLVFEDLGPGFAHPRRRRLRARLRPLWLLVPIGLGAFIAWLLLFLIRVRGA